MDILVKLTIPNYVYKFYDNASQFIAQTSTEELMADALSGYAGMLSKDVAMERQRESDGDEPNQLG